MYKLEAGLTLVVSVVNLSMFAKLMSCCNVERDASSIFTYSYTVSMVSVVVFS